VLKRAVLSRVRPGGGGGGAALFRTRTKKQWKKVVLFLSDMKFCFFKRLASAIEEGTTSLVPGICVIGDQIKSSTVPYLGKQIFPGQNSNLPSGRSALEH
jgi:hypothetical protein